MVDTIPAEDSLAALEQLAKGEPRGRDAADKAPTASRPRPKAAANMPSKTSAASLERQLKELFKTVGGVVTMFDDVCGPTVINQAEVLAAAWAKAANQNPRLKKVIESLLSGGTYGEVIIVTAMTLFPILVHHGIVPAGLFGTAEDIDADTDANAGEAISA